jgi:opacity protein-like surface antigen
VIGTAFARGSVRCCGRITAVLVMLGGLLATPAFAQAPQARDDERTQYPAFLANSYFTIGVGYIGYDFSAEQLQPGFHAASITVPHVAANVALFGHQFSEHVSAQVTYMRPVHYVVYRDVNGDGDAHHMWMHFGGATLKATAPLGRRLSVYGEGGLGITSRKGFDIDGSAAIRDSHYAAPLVGGGVEYRTSRRLDLVAGALYSPGRTRDHQPHTVLVTGGFRYTMRPLPAERVEANRRTGYIFPVNVVQLEYSTGYGYGVNTFVSRKVPVFWGGNVKVDRGIALHYNRNVFHTRKIFALDFGTSASYWRSRGDRDRFVTASVYPLFRFTFLRSKPADVYAVYSLAGPTFISRDIIDGSDTGNRFTFQDFMGLGAFVGQARRLSVGVKINHYSNGNIFTKNAGVKIPLTFSAGYTF